MGVQCDHCHQCPIIGPRFTSQIVNDFDLCNVCRDLPECEALAPFRIIQKQSGQSACLICMPDISPSMHLFLPIIASVSPHLRTLFGPHQSPCFFPSMAPVSPIYAPDFPHLCTCFPPSIHLFLPINAPVPPCLCTCFSASMHLFPPSIHLFLPVCAPVSPRLSTCFSPSSHLFPPSMHLFLPIYPPVPSHLCTCAACEAQATTRVGSTRHCHTCRAK